MQYSDPHTTYEMPAEMAVTWEELLKRWLAYRENS